MTLVDTNLLVYASFSDAPEHGRARAWLERLLGEGDGTVALCWPVVYSFVRLISSQRVLAARSRSVREAWSAAEALLAQPAVRIVTAGPRHPSIARELAHTPGLRSDDVPDVELAALAIEHGLVLASHDHGFRRFAGLRFVDPLLAE